MNISDKAVENMKDGCSCSEAMLTAFGPRYGLDFETARMMAGAFGGGIGLTGQTCGAVTGSLMAIGLKCGPDRSEDNDARKKAYELAQKFMEEFKTRVGSTKCADILAEIGFKIPDEWQKAMESGKLKKHCPQVVRTAAEILDELLAD